MIRYPALRLLVAPRQQVFGVMARTPHHRYQILTKRPKRMVSFLRSHTAPANVWLGVSVENRKHGLPRIDLLRQINAAPFPLDRAPPRIAREVRSIKDSLGHRGRRVWPRGTLDARRLGARRPRPMSR
jgi:hypothetical protein